MGFRVSGDGVRGKGVPNERGKGVPNKRGEAVPNERGKVVPNEGPHFGQPFPGNNYLSSLVHIHLSWLFSGAKLITRPKTLQVWGLRGPPCGNGGYISSSLPVTF